ncbi:MAG: HD domain-containing phosphohydrolase [Chloroflexota bacterium]
MTMPFQRKQILLVEDSRDIRDVLVNTLETERYTVYQAENGQAALKVLQLVTPDLIISDINMPRMNGIEFYKAVRQNPVWTAIPFIFLSANNTPEDVQAGRSLGVEDYLTKPIDPRDLVSIVSARLLRAAQVQIAQIGQAYLETVNVLANVIEGRDPYTHGHVERVAAYAWQMGTTLNWSVEAMRSLDFGARLHDIGKIIVPDHVLKKNGPLTDVEWELMKQHPESGAKILNQISHLKGTIPYVLRHHEHWDGTGYPHGLKGKDIPVEGRLLAVVDVYDALTTNRPYHPARLPAEVVKFLQLKAEVYFDPRMVEAFLDVLKKE